MEDTFKGDPSTSLGFMDLNSLILQDDISKMNDKLEDTRAGCEKIDNNLNRKQLLVKYFKCKFLTKGDPKYRKDPLKEIKERPMIMGGVVIEHSEKEKYLGAMIHEKGCKESITATIKARTNGLVGKGEEIIQVSETPIIGGNW